MKQRQEGWAAAATPAADPEEAARACLFSVVDRFNTEDPFWGSFVPELDSTRLGEGRFSLELRGLGARVEVQGVMLIDAGSPHSIKPSIVVGAIDEEASEGSRKWHPVACDVDDTGRFTTSNFKQALEAAVEDFTKLN